MCGISVRQFCQEWRLWIRPLLVVTYGIFSIIVVPLLIVNSVKDGFQRRDQLILIGGLFVLSAVPISIWHIVQHSLHFTKPILQKHIIRILWMVPIYALNAWIGLWFPDNTIYVDSLRECYEAYVIYNFMVYLLNYLNLGMDLEASMEFKPQVKHIFPLCCLRPWVMGREFIHNCKHGILQYTIVRPITTFISVICQLSGVYGEGTFAGNVAFPYILVINNISQFLAMYCLVLFYRANKDDLKPMKPIPKFLCIKAVVFFSFFQGVLLNLLVYFGVIKDVFGSTISNDADLASMLQNFLICIEMFIAAVAHIYSFPHHPFHINSAQYWNNPNNSWCRAFLSMIDISDVQEDVTEHLGVVGSSISRHFQGRSNYQPLSRGPRSSSSESDYLMSKRQDDIMSSATSQVQASKTEKFDTGKANPKKKNRNFFSSTSTAAKSNVARYGAMDSLVLPVNYDDAITNDSQSQLAAGSIRPSTSKAGTTLDNVNNTGASFGINIQNRDASYTRDYNPHYGAPGVAATGDNFLQARNPRPESIDEFASFIGSGGSR